MESEAQEELALNVIKNKLNTQNEAGLIMSCKMICIQILEIIMDIETNKIII